MRLARFGRPCDGSGRARLAHGDDLVGSHFTRDYAGDRSETDERGLDHSRDRVQAMAV